MDKQSKLQRYSHKDYSDLVDFPVEIVGRDGVIRRYSFEDSVRLYQRRVTFAPIRYRDRDLVEAEIGHCRHRIEQLRRSFFYRFGWGTPEGEPHPEDIFGEVAGEIAAFLRRVLRVDDRPDVRIEPVQPGDGGVGTWFVVPAGSNQGMLLYVHRFDAADRDSARDRFFSMLKSLERSSGEERLLAFHHAADCGFVLTAQEGEFDALVSITGDDGIIRDVTPTGWERVVDQVRLGRYADALEAAEQVVSLQALDRRGYVLGAALAEHLERPVDLLSFAQVGALYFPDDPDVLFWLGVARGQMGDLRGATEPLRRVLQARPDSALARAALLPILLRRFHLLAALRLALTPPGASSEEPTVAAALRAMARSTRLTGGVLVGTTVIQATGVVVLLAYGWIGVVVVALGALLSALVIGGYLVELRRLMGQGGLGELSWWARRLARDVRSSPLI